MNNLSSISIIIPCRNEENFIGRCLDSLLENDYPKDKLEIFVIDGRSEDKTREILKNYQKKFPSLFILDNPKKITPAALNIGIRQAKNDIIIRIDAHATYKRDYIFKSVRYLQEYKADNVGGIWVILPREETLIGKAIAIAMSNVFGTGNAYYKIGVKEFKWVDTVPFGCYRKEIFQKVGFFNENLIRSQDMEFNLRLRKNGGKILLIPEIVGYYYIRSHLKDFFVHNFKDGIWAILPLKFVKIPFCLRHYIPLVFILTFLATGLFGIFIRPFIFLFLFLILFYFLTSIYFSVRVALKEKNLKFIFVLPLIFAVRHFGYGFGSLWGLVRLIL